MASDPAQSDSSARFWPFDSVWAVEADARESSRVSARFANKLMIEIREALAALSAHATGTVVYIGAGIGSDVSDVAALGALRCVFVDGSQRVCSRLERRCRGRSSMEIVHAVVGPVQTTATWYSHNLRRFDGLIDAQALSSLYPRLASTGSLNMSVEAIDSLLARLDVQITPERQNLLIVDVPGAAAALLECVTDDRLMRFEHIIVRHDLPIPIVSTDDSAVVASALARLDLAAERAGYRLLSSVPDRTALWALSCFRSDPLARQNAELTRQISELKNQLVQAGMELQAARERDEQAAIRRGRQSEEITSLGSQLDAVRADRANIGSQVEQLRAERDQLAHTQVILVKQIEHWSAEAARLAAQSEEHHAGTLTALRELEQQAQRSESELSKLRDRLQVCQLDNENAAIDRQLVREELLRAEAQIELLADIACGEVRP